MYHNTLAHEGEKLRTYEQKGMEIWKPIPGLEDYYEASSYGRIKSLPRMRQQCNLGGPYERLWPEKIKTLGMDRWGYLSTCITDHEGTKRKRFVHHLVAEAFIGEMPEDCNQINHKDCDKTNNRPENLEWCDGKKNQRHSFKNGTHSLNLHRCPITGRVLPKGTESPYTEPVNGYVGISFNKQRNKWHAYITRNGNNTFLGGFTDKQDAINARKKAELL